MGNSEVGHLNLGAGAIVPQDLARIDKAVEDGSLAENEVILDALRDAPRVHLIGLVSDGGVHSSDRHLKALIEIAAKEGVEDLVVHAFTDGRDTSPTAARRCSRRCRGGWTRRASGGSAPSSAATSRWTATRAGTARRRPSKLLMEGEAEHEAESGEAAAKRGLRARRDRRVHHHDEGRRRGLDDPRPATRCSRSTSAPTACARSPRRSTKAGVDRYATLTEYEEGWPYPVAFPPDAPRRDAGEAHLRARRDAAARRGDREVPARDVLLQRRRGGAVRGRGARARRLARATSPPTTRSPR